MGLVAEIPSGALADRFSRRLALVGATLLQALGYVLWITLPGYAAFAAGFVLWGIGGAFASGSLEALTYEGLAYTGREERYPRLQGRLTAAELISEIPTALAASALFAAGGFQLAGWVSIAFCLAASVIALRLPEAPRARPVAAESSAYLATLKEGIAEIARQPSVRAAVAALAVVGGIDGLEEYFPLLASRWGIPTVSVPVALLAIPIAGAAGAALGGRASTRSPASLGFILAAGAVILGAMELVDHSWGLLGVSAFYFLYHVVLVALEVRLQERIQGPSRATVTSVAGLGIELTAILFFALWAAGGLVLVAGVALIAGAGITRLLREERQPVVG